MGKRKIDIKSGLEFLTSDKPGTQKSRKPISKEPIVKVTFELPASVAQEFEEAYASLNPRAKRGDAPKLKRRDLAAAALKRGLSNRAELEKELQA